MDKRFETIGEKLKCRQYLIEACKDLYEILAPEQEQAPSILRYFYSEVSFNKYEEDTEEKDKVDDEFGISYYTYKYRKVIIDNVEAIQSENYSIEEFYLKLWLFISSDIVLPEINSKIYALYCIKRNICMPYYHLADGLQMSDEDYRTRSNSLMNIIRESRYIIKSPYSMQKTQRASLLYDLLKAIKSDEDRIVAISHMIEQASDIENAMYWIFSSISDALS